MIKSISAEAREIADGITKGDDFETALADPAAYYADPETIVADEGLSTAQKRRFLSEWAQDLTDRQVADQEGMTSDTSAQDDEADMTNRIRDALDQLTKKGSDAEDVSDDPGASRRWWQRLRAA